MLAHKLYNKETTRNSMKKKPKQSKNVPIATEILVSVCPEFMPNIREVPTKIINKMLKESIIRGIDTMSWKEKNDYYKRTGLII